VFTSSLPHRVAQARRNKRAIRVRKKNGQPTSSGMSLRGGEGGLPLKERGEKPLGAMAAVRNIVGLQGGEVSTVDLKENGTCTSSVVMNSARRESSAFGRFFMILPRKN